MSQVLSFFLLGIGQSGPGALFFLIGILGQIRGVPADGLKSVAVFRRW